VATSDMSPVRFDMCSNYSGVKLSDT
jgi:hypothetical protein